MVGNGGQLRDIYGQLAEVADLYTLPMGLQTFRVLAALALTRKADGYELVSIDADGAYFQSVRRGPPAFVVLPGELVALLPEATRTRMRALRTPAFRLRTPLYGETDAGDDWSAHLAGVLVELHWARVEAAGGEQLWMKKVEEHVLLLGLYVDDGAAVGAHALILAELSAIGLRIVFKSPQVI